MVPGITDTECRINQLRYRELHAEANRQRLATMACTQNDWGGVTKTLQRGVAILMGRCSHFMHRLRVAETGRHATAPGALAVSK